MKAQQLVQYMAPRAMFGGVWNTSKSVYSSGSQLLLSRPSVSGAYLKKSQENQLLGVSVMLFLVPSSCLSFFFYRFHLYCFQHVAADVFSIFGLSCTVSSTWQVCVFFLAIESFRTTEFGGACHYLTNRFQMEAPVAPSRSLQEASVGMAEAFAKPSRSLLGGFSKPSAPATSS